MKKTLALALALVMVLSVGAISALAADSASIVVTSTATEPLANGDIFTVDVAFTDISTNAFLSGQIAFEWNNDVAIPVAANGTAATAARPVAFIARDDMYNSSEFSGTWSVGASILDPDAGTGAYALYIDTGSENSGVPQAVTDSFHFVSIRFQAVVDNGTFEFKIADREGVTNKAFFAVGTETNGDALTKGSLTLTVGTPAAKTVVNSITAPAAVELEVGEAYTLPATVDVVTDGGTVALPVVWTPATIDTTLAGATTVNGVVTLGEDYEMAAGVENAVSFTVTVTEAAVIDPNLPITFGASEQSKGQISVSLASNPNFDDSLGFVSLAAGDQIVFVVTWFKDGVPVAVSNSAITYDGTLDDEAAQIGISNMDVDSARISIATGIDFSQPFGANNLGTPLSTTTELILTL